MGNLVDTGLGWYADENWLSNQAVNIGTLVKPMAANVNAAGEYLASVSFGGSSFYKTNNGPAYLFVSTTGHLIVDGYSVNWVLLGTSQEAVAVSGAGTVQLTIYGETWYRTAQYWNWPLTGYNQAAFANVIPDGSYTGQQYYEMCVDYIGGYPGSRLSANSEPGQSVDTGLGWSANSDYLVYNGGMTFATIAAGVWGTRTYTKRADGYAISVFVNSGWKYIGPLTISTKSEYVEQMVNGTSLSPATGTVTYLNRTWYYNSGWWMPSGDVEEVTNVNILPYNVGQPSDIDIDAIVLAVLAAADVVVDAPIVGTTEYDKSTGGYSVTCFCKWITSYGGDIYFSPVLISSQPNNTLYTRGGSTPSVNVTEHEYGGITFYMRKAPLDILDGSETISANYPIVDLSGVAQTNGTIFTAIAYQSSLGVGYIPGDEDPYAPGGTSGPGGGTDTDFDITGDTILDSPLPTFSFANSGFARIYNPNLSQLQKLANYLWTDTTFLQTIVNHAKQLLEDPIESIITLNRLPISVPNGTDEVVKVLYIPTNTSMPPVTNQFVDVDCGTLQIKHEYDSALDYNPYTDISLVLPFIGVVQLDPDEVMDKTLSLTYRVDVVSGMCVAKVAVDGCVLYQYSGNCAISMPFNSADFSNYISAMVTAAKSITGVAAAGAAGAMAAAAEGTEAVKAIVAKATSGEPESTGPSLPAPSNKSTNVFKETFGKGGVGEGTLKAAKKGVANTVGAVVSSKRTIEHAGHFSGNSGFLGVRRPYAIIKRPKMCNPKEYGRFNGRPCMMYLYLGNLSGYTEVQEIHLTGILTTNDELIEIENLLKSGVIL